jgi:hypothetical protein
MDVCNFDTRKIPEKKKGQKKEKEEIKSVVTREIGPLLIT